MSEAGTPIRVGISSCLLGSEVRFDGGHKRDSYICGTLADWFEFVPVCPEFEAGLGLPRPPIRLVGDVERPRVVGVRKPELDVTVALEEHAADRVGSLTGLSGYILKKDSPSCGMERVKVYPEAGGAGLRKGVGVFARALMARWPLLPVEEEGRLGDSVLRENFIQRVFVLHRWQALEAAGLSKAALIDFHAAHKLVLMAHHQAEAKMLGQRIAKLDGRRLRSQADDYIAGVMAILAQRATRARHVNVLQHLAGYLKREIDADDKAELVEVIAAYRRGEVPLVVPLTLFKHHFRRHPDPYVARQHYLEPHPRELMLRNVL
ncbi:MAG: DUF1722 domain-containing protein [Gammaproteobacteria bacterium]|jgi:uncharacterized protein YbgA (DUF1722 family)/uncharacterized protein YbbK (DUF523 family)|nr:DUF1722 domain-containing protein [Gammaproteobacteria bacterium]